MRKLVLVLLLAVGLASPAFAGPIGQTGTLDYTRLGGYYSGGGGEFTVYNYTGVLENDAYSPLVSDLGPASTDPSFQTFCLELDERTAHPMYYEVASQAVQGGAGGPSPDPLSLGTAYLYSQFVAGSLAGYFAGVRSVEAGLLQDAIWMLEEEIAINALNPYYAMAALAFANPLADADPGYLDVYVLNNFADRSHQIDSQDMLWVDDIPTPDGGATLMLLGGALIGLGALRRKVRK